MYYLLRSVSIKQVFILNDFVLSEQSLGQTFAQH